MLMLLEYPAINSIFLFLFFIFIVKITDFKICEPELNGTFLPYVRLPPEPVQDH